MGGEDAAGKLPSTFEGEVRQSFDNIGAVLKEVGMSPSDVVSVQVYLTDVDTFERMNAVYRSYFKEPRPARNHGGSSEAGGIGTYRTHSNREKIAESLIGSVSRGENGSNCQY